MTGALPIIETGEANKMKKLLTLLCTAICVTGVTSCGSPETDGKISVYTSFYAMYDFAREIGGDKISLHNVCPTGTEPHDFEPTARDMASISEADVFIYNGLGMESWTDSVLDALGDSKLIAVNTSENTGVSEEHHDSHSHEAHSDVHIWLDPNNAYLQMEAIADALAEADPENSDYYAERLNKCREKIDTLIADYEKASEDFRTTDIITSHEAYSSLCEVFDLTQIALNGADNSHDPTPARLAEITDYIKANNIKYIFSEPLGTSSVVETVANDTDCNILTLDPFEGNTEDKDYFTVMYENLDALKTALN